MLAITVLALGIPLHFEPNRGQLEPHIRYFAVASGGEVLVVYATGLGKVAGTVADGVPAPNASAASSACQTIQPGVMIGGAPESDNPGTSANILYAGLTPGYVGLYQLNVQLPASTPAGNMSLYIYWPGCWYMGAGPRSTIFSNVVALPLQ